MIFWNLYQETMQFSYSRATYHSHTLVCFDIIIIRGQTSW